MLQKRDIRKTLSVANIFFLFLCLKHSHICIKLEKKKTKSNINKLRKKFKKAITSKFKRTHTNTQWKY